ncbi:MAG TPA: DUF3524 domain-containing protein [Candidatus Krumholzibacteria bacterium]|nr:DUF3524 domain-containing protein [Candidatus Krumholzibacteria bacterium]HRX49811.1 DUF3524 domain-containing protein [Candidatus Krumholzibacteria bacterium]
MRILFIEPYDGGSHRAFRESLTARSAHAITSLTLPARFWKWRMRSAAVWFGDRIREESLGADLILCSDYLNVADLRGLLPPPLDRAPVVQYMHENQLTYPLSPDESFDYHFGFTNILSCLAADRTVFNSAFHRDLFLGAVDGFLGRMPEAVPRDVRDRIAARSTVLPVGIDRAPRPPQAPDPVLGRRAGPPVILWNHRWEFDKRPEWFASSLMDLADEGLEFRVRLLGEERQRDEVFGPLRDRLGDRVLDYGHRDDRADYEAALAASHVVVSCAAQEYFGISVAEAIHAGCHAVLPREQVYPSLYGDRCPGDHFYDGPDGLTALLRRVVRGEAAHVCSLPARCDAFCWERLAPRYDALFTALAEGV